MNYGIPYMGSKNKIMPSLAMNFPSADNFYDLFGGGFSVTHYMIKHHAKKFKYFHYNEIEPQTVDLIRRAIAGEFNYNFFKPEFITREMFEKLKKKDAYVRVCWSFGNNQKSYLFGKSIEKYKKSMHNAVVFNRFDLLAKEVFGFENWPEKINCIYLKRQYLRQKIEWMRKKNKYPKSILPYLPKDRLQQLEQLKQLEQLQQLERLQQLEQLERLNFYSQSYEQIEIKKNSIVYCDIPYQETEEYRHEFNHKDFFDWASSRQFPVYISEYEINDDRFKLIYEIEKPVLLNNSKSKQTTNQEKLYWNGVKLN